VFIAARPLACEDGFRRACCRKDVYLEKPVTTRLKKAKRSPGCPSGNRILQCGMQQRSCRTSAMLSISSRRFARTRRAGAHLLVAELSVQLLQNAQLDQRDRPVDIAELTGMWLGSRRPAFSKESFFTGAGSGTWRRAMTDLFTHWIDVVHWAMQSTLPAARRCWR